MTKLFAPLKSEWHFFLSKKSTVKGSSFIDMFSRHNDEHKKGKERNILMSFGPFTKKVQFSFGIYPGCSKLQNSFHGFEMVKIWSF